MKFWIFGSILFLAFATLTALFFLSEKSLLISSEIRQMTKRNIDINNQSKIAEAILAYARLHNGSVPTELESLVNEGLLPRKSRFYASPFSEDNGKEIDVKNSSYRIVPLNDGTKPFFYVRTKRVNDDGTDFEEGYFEINTPLAEGLKKISKSKISTGNHSN